MRKRTNTKQILQQVGFAAIVVILSIRSSRLSAKESTAHVTTPEIETLNTKSLTIDSNNRTAPHITTIAVAKKNSETEIPTSRSATASDQPIEERHIRVHVTGMVCDFCARGLERGFKKLAAVASVSVDLVESTVDLTLQPNHTLSDKQISTVVNDSGVAVKKVDRR